MTSQLNEVNVIRRSLYDLEAQQRKARQHYEDEISRLRAEIATLRQSLTTPNTAPSLGIPGLSPPHSGHGHATAAITDTFLRDRDRERTKERGLGLGALPPDCERDREKSRERREVDRVLNQRNPQRREPESIGPGARSPLDIDHTTKLQAPHSFNAAGPSTITLPPRLGELSDYHGVLPSLSARPQSQASEESNGLPEFRKVEGSDWFALYNPKAKKNLEINLVHSFTHPSVVCCVQFSSDGRYLATGCNRTAQIYDVKTGAKICILADDSAAKSGDLYIRSVRFSPDGKYLATGAEDRKVRIWDITKKRIVNVFDGHQQEIYSLDFSKDGRLIVSGSGDRTTRIWDMLDGSCKILSITDAESINTDAGVTSVAISPNGRLVAAGSLDTIVRIWDVSTGTLVQKLQGHQDSVYSVVFTTDGRSLVSGSLDKTLKCWDVSGLLAGFSTTSPGGPSPSPPSIDFVGHKDYVLSVGVSHDGQWIASGSKDRCVQFWDARSATLQFMLHGHRNSVISLDLNPQDSFLATGSGDSVARIWRYMTSQ
ncbi:WD40 repeat-like protein [Tricholoma matsutake]|nr:WD40 repeat-like protein [Tricholoma matsutake 945]